MQVLTPLIRPGMTVGLTVGSRGIQNILTMLEVAVQAVRGCGASPVLLAAMGSHGGGTRQGQKDVLDSLGITEERLGAPVITCDVTRAIGETPGGLVAHMLESAFGVDAIIPINRVKTHTSFKGCVESGLCKKLVVGLGGPGGAGQFHSLGQAELPRLLVEVTKVILGKMPCLAGWPSSKTLMRKPRASRRFPPRRSSRKKSGCWRGRSRSCPPCPRTGCTASSWRKWGRISAEPESTPISSDGCALRANRKWKARASGTFRYWTFRKPRTATLPGVGLVDFVTRRLVDKIDRKATYLNNLTTTFVTRAFTPLWFDTDREMLETMMFCLRSVPLAETRLILIPNTLYLADCYVSEAILPELADTGRFEVLGPLRELAFDAQGNLISRIGLPRTS